MMRYSLSHMMIKIVFRRITKLDIRMIGVAALYSEIV